MGEKFLPFFYQVIYNVPFLKNILIYFFYILGYILKRVDHMHMFSLMFFTFTLIFYAYTFIKDPLWTLPVEILNGIVFGLTYSAAISYAALVSPAGAEGTLQGAVGVALQGIGL